MALFLSKRPFIFHSKTKKSPLPEIGEEHSFEETQYFNALSVLADFFSAWQNAWNNTKNLLNLPPLSKSAQNSLTLYESDQKNSVITLLSRILVAWVSDNSTDFSQSIVLLAREVRPSLPYVEFEPEENFFLNSAQLSLLRLFIEETGKQLKDLVSTLSDLSLEKITFPDSVPLSQEKAESLLREYLEIPYLSFLDLAEDIEPEFDDSNKKTESFPALLAASAEFDL